MYINSYICVFSNYIILVLFFLFLGINNIYKIVMWYENNVI